MCANCGKGEESCGDLKACAACKLVKYCNRNCQIAHRPQHKKACKKRAAELHDAVLFKEPPQPEDCPICMLPLPLNIEEQIVFESCCGKVFCDGCDYAMGEIGAKDICPFCRTPPVNSDEEEVERLEKLMKKGNADAFCQLAGYYEEEIEGLSQDSAKANELYLKAGELGCAYAYYNLGNNYYEGSGVEVDKKKAIHYYELAALNGDVQARHYLGMIEERNGNYPRACKHYIIAAKAGYTLSLLDVFKQGYMHGHVTKDQYANTLREYQKSQDEMNSDARDKALAYQREIDLE